MLEPPHPPARLPHPAVVTNRPHLAETPICRLNRPEPEGWKRALRLGGLGLERSKRDHRAERGISGSGEGLAARGSGGDAAGARPLQGRAAGRTFNRACAIRISTWHKRINDACFGSRRVTREGGSGREASASSCDPRGGCCAPRRIRAPLDRAWRSGASGSRASECGDRKAGRAARTRSCGR